MNKDTVIEIINAKLEQLENANKHNVSRGTLNFGVQLPLYQHSPILPEVIRKKKRLMRLLWFETFAIAIMMVVILTDWTASGAALWKILLGIIALSALIGVAFIYFGLWTVVRRTNDLQMEIKKMILLDLKEQINAVE